LPGNVAHLVRGLGWLVLATLLGAWLAWRTRPLLAVALLPYPLLALLFFSCWSHPDARYLAGVVLCLLPVTALGIVLPCRALADRSCAARWRAAAAILALACLGASAWPWAASALRIGMVERALAWALLAAALVPLVPRLGDRLRRPLALAPSLAFSVTALIVVLGPPGPRDPFQKERIEQARATLGAWLPAGSLVITSESLGRPAENLSHYVGVHAMYATELPLLSVDRGAVVERYHVAGRRVFFLLRAEDGTTLSETKRLGPVRQLARARGDALYDWFVDPDRAPLGAVLYEADPTPDALRMRREVAERAAAAPARETDAAP
jgi:hypothetical protein